jgi:ABC-type antimicrobial peptide transport system permease subunit
VVGVVRNVKQNNLTGPNDHGTIYSPMQYLTWNTLRFFFVIRTDVSPAMMAPMIRKTVLHVDPGLPVDDLRLMVDRVDDSLVIRRSPAILTTAFGAVALLLAAIGTYGVLSYAVAQRRPEIGLRMALGAQAEQIRNQFVSMGARLFAFGAALGIFGAWAAGLSLRALLFGIPTVHAPIIIADILVMGATTLFACLLPARRAMKVNPMEALRAE